MNTWVVGNHPVGHRILDYPLQTGRKQDGEKEATGKEVANKVDILGEKVFYLKARIMAGQANLAENSFGLKDFKWLAREELEQQVERSYWHSIKNMLPAR
jgi:large subunit ribosomal protein L46